MKGNKLFLAMGGALLLSAGLYAQTVYDITPIMTNELNGTARFAGMGGAMGALGGDITTIGTNPAGIGIYRSNDVSVSMSYNDVQSKGTFNGMTTKDSRSRLSFDQIGFVYSNKIGNNTSLRFVNFGFNYRKLNNFNKRFAMQGNMEGASQTGYMAYQTALASISDQEWEQGVRPKSKYYNDVWRISDNNGSKFEHFYDMAFKQSDVDAYDNNKFGWLSVMGGRTGLVDAASVTEDGKQYVDFYGWNGDYASYRSETKGGVNVYDFNVSFNIEDRFYFGLTVGAYDVDYSRYSVYGEDLSAGELAASYSFENWYKTDGSGVDVKLGFIVRPFEYSPLRLGFAVHTPTWYSLTESYSARLRSEYDMLNGGTIERYEAETDSYNGWGGNVVNDYELTTPWKFNLSAGYTIGTSVALGAEYEYADYSSAKLKNGDGYEDSYMVTQNSFIKEDLKGVHTLRLGMEAKLVPEFSIRAGYNYSSAMYNKNAYKELSPYTTRTDTQYANGLATNTFSVGLGYRLSNFYADMAYVYSTQKSDFYSFDDESLPATRMKDDKSRVLLTLGIRF